KRLAEGGGRFDQLAALEQVVRARGELEVAAVLVGAFLHDGEVAVLGVLGHLEIEGGVVDRLLDDGVRRHVADLFTAVVDGAVVTDGIDVLLGSSETHWAEVASSIDCRRPIPLARIVYPGPAGSAAHTTGLVLHE